MSCPSEAWTQSPQLQSREELEDYGKMEIFATVTSAQALLGQHVTKVVHVRQLKYLV